ncbi:hypothetical protein KSF78_0009630, partial [Schistosoma japonicum]
VYDYRLIEVPKTLLDGCSDCIGVKLEKLVDFDSDCVGVRRSRFCDSFNNDTFNIVLAAVIMCLIGGMQAFCSCYAVWLRWQFPL